MIGGEIQFAQLAFIAHALRIRGAEVTGLLCDEFLPACTSRKVDHYESACTRWCHRNAGPFIRAAGLPHRWYGEFVSPQEKEQCAGIASRVSPQELQTFEWRGIPLGEHVDLSVESYFKVGRFDLDRPEMVAKGRELLTSAMCLTLIGERALEELDIDKVFMEDGMKIDWGVIRAVARHRGIPVDVVLGAPLGACFLIEHDPSPEPSDPLPQWPLWREIPLTASQETELDDYMVRRATKPYEDQDWTVTRPLVDPAEIRRQIGLPPEPSGQVFTMFPNLGYDAGMTVWRPTYDSAAEWVAQTFRFFERWPQHHLIIKVHPSESLRTALDQTTDFLAASFDARPDNLHVIPAETPLVAQDVIRVTDAVMVYTSTVAVEAAYFGKPVINVGGGWHAGRGCSIDTNEPGQYFNILTDICSGSRPLSQREELGRRYAYAVFFRSVLPIRHYSAVFPDLTELHLSSLDDLAPGRDTTMDVICRGVLLDEPFHRPE